MEHFRFNPWIKICCFLMTISFVGCTESSVQMDDAVLIKVGSKVATIREFKQAFETAKAAYSPAALRKPKLLETALYDVLSQLTDELVVSNRADELDLMVTEDELQSEIELIQSDYPDDSFNRMLIEQSVSFSIWKDRLKARLLMEKVIQKDLADRQKISTSDILSYEAVHQDNSDGSDKETAEAVMKQLRRRKAQDTYHDWISGLRNRYTVYVDQELWEELTQ